MHEKCRSLFLIHLKCLRFKFESQKKKKMQNHDVVSLLESTFTLPGILPRLKQEAFDTKTIEESSPPGR